MKSTAIVTLSDANYFNLLMELVDSILRFNESKDISICVLDIYVGGVFEVHER